MPWKDRYTISDEKSLADDATEFLQVRHAGNAGCHRQENHRRNDHAHELDERVAERLHRSADLRVEMAEQDTSRDGGEDLRIEMPVKGELAMRYGSGRYNGCNHDVLRFAQPISRPSGQ